MYCHSTCTHDIQTLDFSALINIFLILFCHFTHSLCKTGSCVYHLGVEDDGTHSLRTFDDLKKSFEVLCDLAEEFGAKVRAFTARCVTTTR